MNEPIPVSWAGFISDTYTLGRFGWDLATEQELHRNGLRAILHHRKFNISAYGELLDTRSYERNRVFNGYLHTASMLMDHGMAENARHMLDHMQREPHAVIEIKAVRSRGDFHILQMPEMKAMQWRDTMPSYETNVTERELHDLPLFAELYGPKAGAQELIIAPEDVQMVLDKILSAQAPGMKEIRARDSRRERDEPETKKVHAQIISLAA